MSGHSKWSTIKRKKAAVDAKRGKIFTKIIRELTVCARNGGSDLDSNAPLRTIVDKAKAANMPQANIERAIQKGAGELEGANYEEITYEGYGPGGVALLIEVLTDNRNRTVGEIRYLLGKHGGNLGETGSVAWKFEARGLIQVNKGELALDDVIMMVVDAGAEDVQEEEDLYAIYTAVNDLGNVRQVCLDNDLEVTTYELTRVPKMELKIEGGTVGRVARLLDLLDDLDDVQNIYTDADFDEAELDG
ncbi:MAG: YebC/PmpR family DNA-binding transcriptional regulator [Candidatus Delongbacteria bacterium]|nr:YebC/PmpR family DNA-binding transcriptional regulator [Candidatus Delongbacteria bacterium]